MALIRCSKCKKEISDRSKKCINCGTPVKCGIYRKRYKCIFFLALVIVLSIVVIIVNYNRDNSYNYNKVPYCDDGYELDNGKCVKFLTAEVVGYECEDSEYYYNVEDSSAYCRLKKEVTTEPSMIEKCPDGFEVRYFFNEYTGKNQMECWGKTGHGYGGISPDKEYSCPEGYTFRYVTVGNSDGQPLCISNDVIDKKYQVSSLPVCPSGYKWQVVKRKIKGDSSKNPNYYVPTNEFAWKNIEGCGKTVTVEAKYRKVHN